MFNTDHSLFQKVSGHELKYTALIGKPSEITFRWAEHCLTREARRLGIKSPMETMYLVGYELKHLNIKTILCNKQELIQG